MMTNERIKQELRIIENRDFTPVTVLSKHLHVSERTIRSDITAINRSSDSIGAEICIKRRSGYYLHIIDERRFKAQGIDKSSGESYQLDSKEQRERQVIRELLSSDAPVSFSKLASIVCITEDTVKTYMQQIKNMLDEFDLNYLAHRKKGILVFGEEKNKRECFLRRGFDRDRLSYITGFDAIEKEACSEVDLEKVQKIIRAALSSYHISTSDRDFKDLCLNIGLTAERVIGRHPVGYPETEPDSPKAILAADLICDQIETLIKQPIDHAERQYVYYKLLLHTDAGTSEFDAALLKNNIEAVLDFARSQYGIDLRQDEILRSNLFKHLNLIFSNRNRESNMVNPLLGTIKQDYPLPYDIALATTDKIFDKQPFSLAEAEVGYIALHIGSAIERNRDVRKKACEIILVCGEGRSVQQMFNTRVLLLFNESTQIVASVSYQEFSQFNLSELNADLILSTVPLDDGNLSLPYLLVDWSLPTHDVQAISRFVTQIRNRNSNVIDESFAKESFIRVKEEIDRDQLLRNMCDELVKSGISKNNIFERVIERESISDTAINDLLAIPHPLVPCTKTTRVSVAILEHPAAWSAAHKQIRIVLLLAIRPSTSKNIEDFYDLITQILSNQTLQKDLLSAGTYEQFIDRIRQTYTPSWC